jgi:hypothetical protein
MQLIEPVDEVGKTRWVLRRDELSFRVRVAFPRSRFEVIAVGRSPFDFRE